MDELRRLSQDERLRFRRRGKVLLLLGFGLFVSGPLLFGLVAMGAFQSGRPGLGFLGPALAFPVSVAGIVCIMAGAIYMRMGYLKAGSEIVATETSGAVQHATSAWARGLGTGLKESGFSLGGGATQVVKVKCRACGYLESEDARFCSRCAKPM